MRLPKYYGARGVATGSCANCGSFGPCKATVGENGETYLFCKQCAERANIPLDNLSLKKTVNKIGGEWPPENFR